RQKSRLRSAGGLGPLVAPATTTHPPWRTARRLVPHVASPTVSITASTPLPAVKWRIAFAASLPASTVSRAPNFWAILSFGSERDDAITLMPAAVASATAAVPTPPPTACTSTL